MISTSILYCNQLDEPVSDDRHSKATRSRHSPTIASLSGSHLRTPGSSVLSNGSSHTRYRVRYLGCNTCDSRSHKLDHGISAYQKPLLDLYSTVVRRTVVLRSIYSTLSPNQVADFSHHGIVIAERDRFHQTRSQQSRPHSSASSAVSGKSEATSAPDTVVTKVITPLSNILLWAAVKLQHRTCLKKSRGHSVKHRQIGVAFVPLSCSEAVLDKNAFVTLTTKQRFLLGLPHPPLFACVLQKVNTSQRFECHLFVCLSTDDAVGMCRRLTELRQKASSIGRLQVPLPGQMGVYSYQSQVPVSQLGSIVSPSRSSNYTFSDLSSLTIPTRHHFSAHSDIEEETEVNSEQRPDSSFNSNLTSAVVPAISIFSKEFSNQENNCSRNFKFKCDPRLFDRKRRITKTNDNFSWTELSSVSSKSISTRSEPKTKFSNQIVHRDYRFQSYKYPENFSALSEYGSRRQAGSASVTSNGSARNAQEVNDNEGKQQAHPSGRSNGTEKPEPLRVSNNWPSPFSDELQNNRLFAKASAKAKSESIAETTTEASGEAQTNQVDSKLPKSESPASQKPKNNSKTFFGDSLRRSNCLSVAPIKSASQNIVPVHKKDTKQVIQKVIKTTKVTPNKKDISIALNSMFIGNDELAESTNSPHPSRGRSSSEETLHKNNFNDKKKPSSRRTLNNVAKTKSVPNITEQDNSNLKHQKNRHNTDHKSAVVLYLPEGSSTSLGVKGFSKSTPVEKWSTMVSSNVPNSPESACELCKMDLNCEECCSFCQAIERQKLQLCPECCHECNDDERCKRLHPDNVSLQSCCNQPYLQNLKMNPQHSADTRASIYPTSFFNRIRRFTWRSLFSSQKNGSLNGSRIWTRIRAGSQRLRGSKRYLKSRREPINRIFLPLPINNESMDSSKMYDEHYLKPPKNLDAQGQETSKYNEHQNAKPILTTSTKSKSTPVSNWSLPTNKPSVLRSSAVKSARTQWSKPSQTKTVKSETIKPFFISHPNKMTNDRGATELALSGQVLSMSSDSGMEECDCHSSTENSPSGYTNTDMASDLGSFNYEVPHAARLPYTNCIAYSNSHNYANRRKGSVKPVYQGALVLVPNGHPRERHSSPESNRVANKKTGQDTRHQASHWSSTNLESELGYMP